MNKKTIIFSILLTTLLFAGCGSKDTSDGMQSTTDTNNTTDTSAVTDMDTTPEPTAPANTMITEQEAKQIALSKVPGATEDDIKKFKKDNDDSIVEYEGEIHYDGMEYEFEIHAYDGTILEWDEEPIKEMTR